MWLEIRDEDSRFPLGAVVNTTSPGGVPSTSNSTSNTTTSTNTTGNITTGTTGNATTSAGGVSQTDQQFYVNALVRLLQRAGLPGTEAVACLQDWVDSDDDVRAGGAEQGSYPQLKIKNGPMDSVEEVYLISRWGPPILPPPEPLQPGTATLDQATKFKSSFTSQPLTPGAGPDQVQSLPNGSDWTDWLTLWSAGKVNLNTAPREVLRCLDPAMTDNILDGFLSQRNQKVLKSQQDLNKIPGIDPDLAFRLSKIGAFKSRYFRVRVVVDEEPGRVALEAIVQRSDDKKLKVVFWRLF
jgi:hypothetical protein